MFKHSTHKGITAIILLLSFSGGPAHAGLNQWSGAGPFATGMANRTINVIVVSPDGKTIHAGTASGTVLQYLVAGAPTVATLPATEVTTLSATLHGTVNANNDSTGTLYFEYGTTTAYGTMIASTPASASGTADMSVTAALTGLTPATTYHYRVAATNSLGTSYSDDAVFSTLSNVTLTIAFAGNGSGSVTGVAAGYPNTSCDKAIPGSCIPATYASGTSVALSAVPDWKSVFASWSGVDTSSSDTATVMLNTGRTVTVGFDPVYKAKLMPAGAYYASIIDAYKDAAVSGGEIQAQAHAFLEDVLFADSRIADITLSGGLNDSYGSSIGYSTLKSLTVRNGKVTVKNIRIK